MTTSVCTWGRGHIDTTSDKHQGSYVWIFPVSPASWTFGSRRASGSQGVYASNKQEGPGDLGLPLSTDPVALPWSLTQSPHLVPGTGISGLEMSLEPLRHTVRLAPLPNTCENLSQKERGRKVGPGNYIRGFEQKWSWHRCL